MAIPIIAGLAAGSTAAGVAGSLFDKKKAKPIDISRQLSLLQDTYAQNQLQNTDLANKLNPLTAGYKTDLSNALTGARNEFAGNKAEYLGTTEANTKEAQDALRKNLYSKTFSGVPSSLQAIREASAAGGGLNTGSYQKAVGDFGDKLAQTLGEGERDIQLQGIKNRQSAQENAFNTFNNLSSKLTDQQINGLTKVLDTGREDLVRQYTTSMGLSQDETQGIIDLLNFQQSGNLAQDTAADAQRQALYNSLIQGGASILGRKAV